MPVAHLDLEIDTQCADAGGLRSCLTGWNVLHSTAVLNTHWQDFSARSFEEDLNLRDVEWTMTGDDTPGTLYLSLARRGDAKLLTEYGFDQIMGVEVYPVEEDAKDR